MICYLDMTFCRSNCVNVKCHRHWSEDKRKAAIKWWGSEDFPLAVQDFSPKCDEYKPPRTE